LDRATAVPDKATRVLPTRSGRNKRRGYRSLESFVGFIVEHLESGLIQDNAESSRQVRHMRVDRDTQVIENAFEPLGFRRRLSLQEASLPL
jgi:hypothetical protein